MQSENTRRLMVVGALAFVLGIGTPVSAFAAEGDTDGVENEQLAQTVVVNQEERDPITDPSNDGLPAEVASEQEAALPATGTPVDSSVTLSTDVEPSVNTDEATTTTDVDPTPSVEPTTPADEDPANVAETVAPTDEDSVTDTEAATPVEDDAANGEEVAIPASEEAAPGNEAKIDDQAAEAVSNVAADQVVKSDKAEKATATPKENTTLKAQADDSDSTEDNKRNVEDGTYVISSAMKWSMVVKVAGNSSKAGANVQLNTSNGNSAEKWTIRYVADGFYNIFKYGTNLALSVAGNKAARSTNIELAALKGAHGANGQLWSFKEQGGYYSLISKLRSTLALDVKGAKAVDDQNVALFTYDSKKDNQKFNLYRVVSPVKSTMSVANGTYTIRSAANTSYGLDIKRNSKENDANVQLYKGNTSQAQKYHFQSDGAGYYVITAICSGKVLSADSASNVPTSNVVQRSYSGANTQKWALHNTSKGVVLVNKATGLALQIARGEYRNGTNVRGYTNNGSAAEGFKLTQVSTLNSGIYRITTFKAADRFVEIKNNSTANGAAVQINESSDLLGQRFELIDVSKDGKELYRIRTAASGGFLTYRGGKLTQYGNHATAVSNANTWELVWNGTYFSLKNVAEGKVLDLYRCKTAAGSSVSVYKPNESIAQHFYYTAANLVPSGRYTFATKLKTNNKLVLSADGTNVELATRAIDDAQVFNLKATSGSSNTYTIENEKRGKLVGVKSGSMVSGGNVMVGGKNQQWEAVIADGGYITFVNKASGRVMDVQKSSAKVGANVIQYKSLGNAGQQWKVTKPFGWEVKNGKYDFYDINGEKTPWNQSAYDSWKRIKNMKSNTKYLGAVDKNRTYTTFFVKQGKVWVPCEGWRCSVGASTSPTPSGVFKTNGLKFAANPRGEWFVCYYWTCFQKDRGFHSIPCYPGTKKPCWGGLGEHNSGGCVRSPMDKAEWVYRTINKGTTIYLY